jgi:hypothetical protein
MRFDIPSILKKIFISFLFILPFQYFPTVLGQIDKDNTLLRLLGLTDEFSLFILFSFVITFILLRPYIYYSNIFKIPFTNALIAFLSIAFISLIFNKVSWFQGTIGIIDITKNIILFYLVTLLYWEKNDLLLIVKGIIIISLILAIVSLLSEAMAIFGHTGIGYLTREAESENLRLGLYRVSSLVGTGQINYLALYGILAFFLIWCTVKTSIVKYCALLLVASLIFLTFSRQGWACFFLMLFMRKKRYVVWGIPFLLLAVSMTLKTGESFLPEVYFRGYVYLQSFTLFCEHPILGIGPGMFGDLASIIFNSAVYDSWPTFFRDYAFEIRGIDCFWPIIWTEFGIAGLLSFLLIFVKLYATLNNIVHDASFCKNDIIITKIASVIRNYVVIIVIMAFSNGFNKPFIIYTFISLAAILHSLHRLTDSNNLELISADMNVPTTISHS